MCEEVGLRREETALWNVVPYCLSSPTISVNPNRADIRDAIKDTRRFIAQFTSLCSIVFCGNSAQYSRAQLNLDQRGQLSTYHTGNKAYYRYNLHIRETFKTAAELTRGQVRYG